MILSLTPVGSSEVENRACRLSTSLDTNVGSA